AACGHDAVVACATVKAIVAVGNGGEDTLRGGTGADTMAGGDDADTFIIEDGFGSDSITGGEGTTDPSDSDDDRIDLSALSGPVTVTYSGDEAGAITDGTDTLSFAEIEALTLTDHDDRLDLFTTGVSTPLNVAAGDGADTLMGFTQDDSLSGEAGHDEIWGHFGADSLDGGAGD
ncbi:MAG: hypothetical protein AAFV47_15310, partial [Pseudomonadota bacterium]